MEEHKDMAEGKIKPMLNGSAETMLQSFYARAMYSRNPKHRFHDKKAEEIVDKLDYDFSKASGLDTRFYRMDNGKLTWYNLDLPETIEVRDSVYNESGRISTIGCSAFDPSWADKVTVRGKMLFIIEGLTMYLTAEQVKAMLSIIRDNFDNAYVCMECICPKFVNREKIEKSIQETGAVFTWGANSFDELGDIAEGFRKVKDDNILRGMHVLNPVYANVYSRDKV